MSAEFEWYVQQHKMLAFLVDPCTSSNCIFIIFVAFLLSKFQFLLNVRHGFVTMDPFIRANPSGHCNIEKIYVNKFFYVPVLIKWSSWNLITLILTFFNFTSVKNVSLLCIC